MKILWFTWKDLTHPEAGGAEVMNEELAKRLVKDGHTVIFLVGGYKNCKKQEVLNGYTVIRLGNRYTVYIHACIYYLKNLRGWADKIIEEVNTVPFMTQWYAKEKRILLIYQLSREIWFHQIFFPLSIVGYVIEPLYLWLLRKNRVITESESTKKDLEKYGFLGKRISIIPIGITIKTLSSLSNIKKYIKFTILSFGAIRSMKRTLDQVKGFEIAKKTIPELQMKIAGNATDSYGIRVLKFIETSEYKKDIEYLGKVSNLKKIELMQKTHLILVTSVKEGWGLIVTESQTQGTPAIAYNVDGLRDSVKDAGVLTLSNTPESIATEIVKLYTEKDLYAKLQKKSLALSNTFSYENSYKKFSKELSL